MKEFMGKKNPKTQIEPTNERDGKSTETDIKCSCGKLIAKERGGKIYVWCKSCRREVELKFEKESQNEPNESSIHKR